MTVQQIDTAACQVGRCRRRPASPVPACDTVYACQPCQEDMAVRPLVSVRGGPALDLLGEAEYDRERADDLDGAA